MIASNIFKFFWSKAEKILFVIVGNQQTLTDVQSTAQLIVHSFEF